MQIIRSPTGCTDKFTLDKSCKFESCSVCSEFLTAAHNPFQRDEKQFDTLIEAITWLGDKDNNPSYYCIVYVNATGRIAHVGWLD